MTDRIEFKSWIEQWRRKLGAGTLADADLSEAMQKLGRETSGDNGRQRLLYLQAETTGVDSSVFGMSIVENGQILEAPDDPDQWPYATVLDAMQDGWRVIKFPEMAMLLQEDKTTGLGCEFILEKFE